MKKYELLVYPAEALRKKAKEVKNITKEIRSGIETMIKILQEKEALGIAGNQIGLLKRVIVIRKEDQKVYVLINPKIIEKSKEEQEGEEGCLSLPGISLMIKRAIWVVVLALDMEGREIKLKAKDLEARVIQHEIDHLDGILIIDKK